MRMSDVKELIEAFYTVDGYAVCNGHEVYGVATSCPLYIAGCHKANENLIAVIGTEDRTIRFYLERNTVYKKSPAERN